MEKGFINGFDGTTVYRYLWDDVENPKGVVQIFHGMAEHAGRYEDFALFLNKHGYIVFADDHRAHGYTAGNDLAKYFGYNVVEDTINDELYFSKLLKEKYNLPLYVFGHSYGSFICQAYIQRSNYHEKAILCGSSYMHHRIDIWAGRHIARITIRHKGYNHPAKMIEKASFGQYDKQVKEGSWLNSNKDEVQKYYKDEFNGKTLCAGFYLDFFNLFKTIYKKKNLALINKDIPLLLIAGQNDPVGSMGKGMKKLEAMYKKLDIKDLSLILYEGCRHEILNETIHEKVYDDILKFLEK